MHHPTQKLCPITNGNTRVLWKSFKPHCLSKFKCSPTRTICSKTNKIARVVQMSQGPFSKKTDRLVNSATDAVVALFCHTWIRVSPELFSPDCPNMIVGIPAISVAYHNVWLNMIHAAWSCLTTTDCTQSSIPISIASKVSPVFRSKI